MKIELKDRKLYEVTYYYLASGMEGNPDIKNFGRFWAESEEDAVYQVARMEQSLDLFKWMSAYCKAELVE